MTPRDKVLQKMTGVKETQMKGVRGRVQQLASRLDKLGVQRKSVDDKIIVRKGLIEELEQEIMSFLEELTEDESEISTLAPKIAEVVMSCLASSAGEEDPEEDEETIGDQDSMDTNDMTPGTKEGYDYNEEDPSMSPNLKERKLMSTLIETQQGLFENVETIAKSLDSFAGVPTVLETLVKRIARVEKQLGGRPKAASTDVETIVEDDDLLSVVKEQMAKFDPFWGTHTDN